LKIFLVAIIITLIIITWAIAMEQGLRQLLKFGDSTRDGFMVAIISTIIGIVLLRILNIDIDDAIGIDI
jgi:hypothetical protein